MIAQWIITSTGTARFIGLHIVILCATSLWAVSTIKDDPDRDLLEA